MISGGKESVFVSMALLGYWLEINFRTDKNIFVIFIENSKNQKFIACNRRGNEACKPRGHVSIVEILTNLEQKLLTRSEYSMFK